MHYLSKADLLQIRVNWQEIIQCIKDTVLTLKTGDFAQPVKPYLRYRNLTNRIIAMPAYVGGPISFSGIKWIASFPDNIQQDLPRANSVTILNDADTGIPQCIINTSLISGIRTAGVSGLIVSEWAQARQQQGYTVGITGFGPIGRLHLDMISQVLGNSIAHVNIFDIRDIDTALIPGSLKDKVSIVSSWETAYENADIFMTCTVSKRPYIDKAPKKGSLQLNVSLRDYQATIADYVDLMIVDDWEEVCRENTDIEVMHNTRNLQKEDTHSIVEVINDNLLTAAGEQVVMFNPMGMAVFDIATAVHYYQKAKEHGIGVILAD